MGVVYEAEDHAAVAAGGAEVPARGAGRTTPTRRAGCSARRRPSRCSIIPTSAPSTTSTSTRARAFIAMERVRRRQPQAPHGAQTLTTPKSSTSPCRSPRRSRPRTPTGVVHRDIKPGNILSATDGAGEGARLRAGAAASRCRDTGELGCEGSTIPGPAARHRQLHGARADPADAAGSAQRSVFAGRRDLRDGDGEAALCGRVPDETVTNILEKAPIPVTELTPRAARGARRVCRAPSVEARGRSLPVGRGGAGGSRRDDALKGGPMSNLLRRLRPR